MQELTTVARPYAQAAFELARDQGSLAAWSEMLRFLALVVADPQLQRIIGDPRVPKDRLVRLLLDIGGDRVSDAGRNFLRLLVESGRLRALAEIARLFDERRHQAEGVAQVEVISAFEPDPAQLESIAATMQKRLKRSVQVSSKVDPKLIAGAVIRVGDTVIDASVRGRLRQLANQLN